MKNLYLISIAAFFTLLFFNNKSYAQSSSNELNFYEVQKQFYAQHGQQTNAPLLKANEEESREAGIYRQFKRWEWFMEPRVYPSGQFPEPQILFNEFKKYQAAHPSFYAKPQMPNAKLESPDQSQLADWTPIGPDVVPSSGGGLGRINCLAFDPTNSNNMFIGAACGGLWKTTDGGASWTSNTDFLPSLSISDIAINPLNTNIIYIATGDKYGIYSQYDTRGQYSAGILKSTDGGATWNTAGTSYAQNANFLIQRLIINPVNTDVLLQANKYGILRTTNGGQTWSNVKSGSCYDVEFNPLNPNVAYSATSTSFFRSNDGGLTWNLMVSNMGTSGRHNVAVSPADTSVVYVWCNANELYRSADGGTTFTLATSPLSGFDVYGYYDDIITVSSTDANVLCAGGVIMAKSVDGGTTWNIISDWSWPAANYVHADCHTIEFLPGSGTTVFACNDGGIFKSVDGGTSWADLSGGIAITQFYRFANAPQDANLIYAGAQDNGTDRFNGSSWTQVYGADGMEPMVDYNNSNNVYVSWQGGEFEKSTDGGATFTPVTPSGASGAWTTPFVMHPTNPQILYAGYSNVYKSVDGGLNWNTITSGQTKNAVINALTIAPSDPNYIYFSFGGKIYKTTDGGSTWSNITSGLPLLNITYITVSPIDSNKVWVTMSGYIPGDKVFLTTNGGVSWTNVSGSLPNVPANCIEYEKNSNDGVYVGTDLGVFYTDATMTDWISFNDGLPNVIIDQLDIHYGAGKLRAATYGRGIWESDLYSKLTGVQPVIEPSKAFTIYPNPTNGIFNLYLNGTSGNTGNLQIKAYDAIGDMVKEFNLNPELIAAEKTITLDFSLMANGVYFLKIQSDKIEGMEKVFVVK